MVNSINKSFILTKVILTVVKQKFVTKISIVKAMSRLDVHVTVALQGLFPSNRVRMYQYHMTMN